MANFFNKTAFNGQGMVSGFRDLDLHSSTFNSPSGRDHLTFHDRGHDFSLETNVRLNGFNQMGGLEQRTTFLDAYYYSPLKR